MHRPLSADAGRQRASLTLAIPLGLLRLYKRLISPLLPPMCRFYPTCSEYSYEALRRHGILKGSWQAVRRLSRCHPFHPGGFDPVP